MSDDHLCVVGREKLGDRDTGYVCFRCSNRILRWLRELEEFLPVLPREKRAAGITEYQRPEFGSRSPANDDALLHTDPRGHLTDKWNRLECGHLVGEAEHARCPKHSLGALQMAESWAAMVAEDCGIKRASSPFLSLALLRRNHAWICRQPWVDEYAAELRQVHGSVRALAGEPIPRSQGKCIRWHKNVECKGDVYELDDASGVKCSKCGDVYTGLDLDRLRVANEQEAS